MPMSPYWNGRPVGHWEQMELATTPDNGIIGAPKWYDQLNSAGDTNRSPYPFTDPNGRPYIFGQYGGWPSHNGSGPRGPMPAKPGPAPELKTRKEQPYTQGEPYESFSPPEASPFILGGQGPRSGFAAFGAGDYTSNTLAGQLELVRQNYLRSMRGGF